MFTNSSLTLSASLAFSYNSVSLQKLSKIVTYGRTVALLLENVASPTASLNLDLLSSLVSTTSDALRSSISILNLVSVGVSILLIMTPHALSSSRCDLMKSSSAQSTLTFTSRFIATFNSSSTPIELSLCMEFIVGNTRSISEVADLIRAMYCCLILSGSEMIRMDATSAGILRLSGPIPSGKAPNLSEKMRVLLNNHRWNIVPVFCSFTTAVVAETEHRLA